VALGDLQNDARRHGGERSVGTDELEVEQLGRVKIDEEQLLRAELLRLICHHFAHAPPDFVGAPQVLGGAKKRGGLGKIRLARANEGLVPHQRAVPEVHDLLVGHVQLVERSIELHLEELALGARLHVGRDDGQGVVAQPRGTGGLGRRLDGAAKVVGMERLDQVPVGAVLDRPHRRIERGIAGDEDHGNRFVVRAQDFEKLEPADARQVNVEKHRVEWVGLLESAHCGFPRVGEIDQVPCLTQRRCVRAPDALVVVDDENSHCARKVPHAPPHHLHMILL
jgi:hypothetical protein